MSGFNSRRNRRIRALYDRVIRPPRVFVEEGSDSAVVPTGHQGYWIPTSLASTLELDTYSVDTQNQDGASLGEGGTNNTYPWIGPCKLSIRITNPNSYYLYLEIYSVVCKRNISDGASSLGIIFETAALRRVRDGWNDVMAAADESINFPNATINGRFLSTKNQALGVYESERFTGDFRVMRVSRVKLSPGDSTSVSMGSKAIGLRSLDFYWGDEDTLGLRKYTMFPLIRIRSSMGHSALDIDKEQTLGANIHVEWMKRYSFGANIPRAKETSYANTRNTDVTDAELITAYTAEGELEA